MIFFPKQITLHSLFTLPFFLLIIAGLMIPSDGQHGALNIKSLALVFSLFGTLFVLAYRKKIQWNQFNLLALILCSVTFLLSWMIIFIDQNLDQYTSSIDQFKIFSITIIVTSLSVLFVNENIITFQSFFKTILFANFAYSLIKISFLFLHLTGIVDIQVLMDLTGIRIMTMGIYGGLTRLQTSVDIITPFLFFFFLQSEKLKISFTSKFKFFYLVTSLISIFLSFSRFLIFAAFLSAILYWFTLKPQKIIKGILGTLFIFFLILLFIGIETVNSIIEIRLFSLANADSDSTRFIQIRSLMETFYTAPFFGKGLGGYSPDLIRDNVNLYSYEVQWVAFLMQFGLIGMVFLVIPLGLIFLVLLRKPLSRIKVSLALLFAFWLFSGFTNPFLISLTSGIVYSLFFLTGMRLNQPTVS